MPIYILLSRLSQQGVQTLQSNPARLQEVNRDVEELGAKVLHQWATLGEFDFVNVVEAPDTATIAKVSVALGARGSTKIETLPALSIDEFVVDDRVASVLDGDAADGDAPRGAGREQLVGVDLAAPAEEVRLGIVRRGAEDRGLQLGRRAARSSRAPPPPRAARPPRRRGLPCSRGAWQERSAVPSTRAARPRRPRAGEALRARPGAQGRRPLGGGGRARRACSARTAPASRRS